MANTGELTEVMFVGALILVVVPTTDTLRIIFEGIYQELYSAVIHSDIAIHSGSSEQSYAQQLGKDI